MLMTSPLEILFEDAHLVAINKPNGLLVHRTKIAADATEFALQLLRDQLGQQVTPVHRLDRPTSGVLLFAKSKEMTGTLQKAFIEHRIDKTYVAIARGYLPDQITVDYPLKNEDRKIEQEAITHFQTLATIELPIPVDRYETARYSLVSIKLETGRRHQIRRHLAHLRHPIIGDVRYGDRHHNKMFRNHFNCPKLLLHARRLAFEHPITHELISIQAQLPEAFQTQLITFGWDQKIQ